MRPFQSDDVAAFESFALAVAYRRSLGDHQIPAQFVTNNVGVECAWVIELDERVVGSVFLGEQLACLLDPTVMEWASLRGSTGGYHRRLRTVRL